MKKDVEREFKEAVNMTAGELKKWLETEESRSVGWHDKEHPHESVGHESGRHIVRILGKKNADLTDEDRTHMAKVVGYVHRHLAQRPSGDVHDTDWRFSLMNWGHDPVKT